MTDYEELVGKTTAYCHMAQFSQQITIVTEDSCILMATMDSDRYQENKEIKDIKEITLYRDYTVLSVLETNEWLRVELNRVGAFDLEAYKKEKKAKAEKERIKHLKQKEKREFEEYQRLKQKYDTFRR